MSSQHPTPESTGPQAIDELIRLQALAFKYEMTGSQPGETSAWDIHMQMAEIEDGLRNPDGVIEHAFTAATGYERDGETGKAVKAYFMVASVQFGEGLAEIGYNSYHSAVELRARAIADHAMELSQVPDSKIAEDYRPINREKSSSGEDELSEPEVPASADAQMDPIEAAYRRASSAFLKHFTETRDNNLRTWLAEAGEPAVAAALRQDRLASRAVPVRLFIDFLGSQASLAVSDDVNRVIKRGLDETRELGPYQDMPYVLMAMGRLKDAYIKCINRRGLSLEDHRDASEQIRALSRIVHQYASVSFYSEEAVAVKTVDSIQAILNARNEPIAA